MNNETTIKRIQELVPDVMKLEFGCEVKSLKDVQGNGSIILSGDIGYNVGQDNFLFKSAQMFGVSSAGFEWERGFKPQYVVLNNYENLKSEFEILGKPITLAVVLLAINKQLYEDAWEIAINSDGQFIRDWGESTHEMTDDWWNLSKDNFNDQSDETKTFIGELLK